MKNLSSRKERFTTILSICSLLFGSFATYSPISYAAAPRITCSISMAAWCLAGFDGHMTMRETSTGRIWVLEARNKSDDPPMRIIENLACSDLGDERMRLISESTEELSNGQTFHRAEYELSTNGCRLVFEIPDGPASRDYRQYMLYGILVGHDKRTQLYKITE